MTTYYAFTAINHDGKVIEPGTKITKSMLPAETVKHMIRIGSIVDFDRTAEPEVEEIELESDDASNGASENEGSEGTTEGTGE